MLLNLFKDTTRQPLHLTFRTIRSFSYGQSSHLLSHRFFDLFEKYGGYKSGKLKLKKPKQLQVKEVSLNITFLLFIIKLTSQESLANLKKTTRGREYQSFLQ